MKSTWAVLTVVGCVLSASSAMAQQGTSGKLTGEREIGIAAYSGGFAVVRDRRRVELGKGAYTIAAADVPATVQRDSVVVTAGDAQVLALRFPLEPLNTSTLLRRFVGQTIKWVTVNPSSGEKTVSDAELLSLSGGITVRLDGLIQTNPPGYPAFDTDPAENRITEALTVSLRTPEAGSYEVDLRYLTGGFGWRADYSGILSPDGDRLTLSGFASISNQTGVDFDGVAVSLIAGDVNRRSAAPARVPLQARAMMAEAADAAPVPKQSVAGDYHRYDLPGRVEVPHGEEKKIPLFETRSVSVERRYRLAGDARSTGNRAALRGTPLRPEVVLAVENTDKSGLGLPIPAGLVRVYSDEGATPFLIGEDRIEHMAVGDDAELTLGKAFDITAERRQTDFRRIGNRGEFEAGYELVVSNARAEPVQVEVVERLYGEWRILRESQLHEQRDAATAVWILTVPGNGSTTLSFQYSVRP